MRIILLGAPGVGKGTHARFIAEKYNLPNISIGNILRHYMLNNNTDLAREIKNNINKGLMVSDNITIKIIKERLSNKDCKNGFLLDGYPRNIVQANILIKENINIDSVIELYIPYNQIITRILGRRIHESSGRTYHMIFNPPKIYGKDDITGEILIRRPDDNIITINNRLTEYLKQTKPLIKYYQKQSLQKKFLYKKINNTLSIIEVKNKIDFFLQQYINKIKNI
ncbi:adenylate kinase family protein [Enterobacteriaceae endosymbiont of Neohaemonia nigricornis]|uniref:adenylate kinase family protein n=1 Tax=Enterobacteriaceae endosymbiont of Neohaemonia nigricornis TaxID=2675792 RepID=UPI001449EB0B|nr:nucleoside monophosphate kinase [Enterobacteriaceae endosymbiont of Neohaemonia nigricornis]QJC30256.1 adenylate kinase [Enterobacteriaceae endosymbiont of Neohaemonia nigricornis]